MFSGFIRYTLTFILVSLSCSLLFAQATLPGDGNLRSYFIKPEMNVEVGQLGFNVVRVINEGDEPVTIKPLIELPEGFAIFNTSLKESTIAPGDSVMYPFRLRASNKASAIEQHEVIFRAFNSQNQLVLENSLPVQPQELHDWDVEIPKKRAYFYPRFNLAEFDVVVRNKGNTPERIELDIRPDRELNLKGLEGERWQTTHVVYVPPNSDTVIKFKASYSGDNDRIYDLSKVHINALSDDAKIYRAVTIEKYTDEYDPFFVDYTLPHTIELGVRSGDFDYDYTPFLKARGRSEYSNQSSFQYYFSNYRLDNPEDFLRNSNYRFLYTKNTFEVGVGAFGSQLGRNIYSQNALMLAYGLELGKNGLLQGYASQDYLDPITSGAAGYNFDNGTWNLQTSAGYNYNAFRKVNTSSILTSSNQIPLFKGHSLTARVNAQREDYYQFNRFSLQGLGWDILWLGRAGSRFNYQLRNNYGSPEMPGHQMGILGFGGKVFFQTLTNRNYWSSDFYSTRRKFQQYNLLGEKTPEIFLRDSYINILYNSHNNTDFTYSIGPSVEFYQSHRPTLKDFAYEDYDLKKFHIEASFILKRNLRVSLIAGMRDVNYEGATIIDETKPDVHLTADYVKNGYGVRLNYNYGPIVTRGLYQYPSDMNYNGIILTPYVLRSYMKDRIKLQIFTSFNYRQDLDFYYANVSPRVEVYLARNWYLNATGNYSYYMQENPEYTAHNSNYYAELSIKKKFGKSDLYYAEKQLRRIKVICYRDENNNFKKDNREKGIEMVKVRLSLIDERTQPGHESFPIDIALLTNYQGNAIFNRIPRGFYQMEVEPLGDMQEYFYVSESHEFIELLRNETYYIPFQKANRIEGRIDLEKTKYSKENPLDLENVKVTAYNPAGNSFSSFTLKDGSFTLYVPGDTIYYIRLNNVFTDKYRIVQNDIMKRVPDQSNTPVVFSVIEKKRQINFKKAGRSQSSSQRLNVKVLEGKIFENTNNRVDKDAEPDFDVGGGTSYERKLNVGKHYVVLAYANSKDEALGQTFDLMDKGTYGYYCYDSGSERYIIFSGEYNSSFDAQTAAKEIEDGGIKVLETIFYK